MITDRLFYGLITVLLISINSEAYSQHKKIQQKKIDSEIFEIKDSFVIDPHTVSCYCIGIKSKPLSIRKSQICTNCFQISDSLVCDSIEITYQTMPVPRQAFLFLFDSSLQYGPQRPDYAQQEFQLSNPKSDWWEQSGIDYSGSFTRGISVGNTQSLVLNSALNLQISGDLGDGIKILGAISDQQIPIQPEGNTRQIQEFDKLFIQLSKKNSSLTAGDIELYRPQSYFMNYTKRSKGAVIRNEINKNNNKIVQQSAIGISKGKFNRFIPVTQNGNQGPYRLQGREGETFIVVLAGTEKVWVDGILMVRGEDADYIIDYNLAEIRFMPRKIISDQSRVIVEFDYSEQNYIRTLATYSGNWINGQHETNLNIYHEQDSKTSAFQDDLDSLDKIALQNAGDDYSKLSRSSIRKAGQDFSLNRVYYKFRDTAFLVGGQMRIDKILVHEPQADSNSLQVIFTETLPGSGHYKLKSSNFNGRVYEWLAPDEHTGELKGNYEPIVPVIAPTQQSLMTIGYRWNFNKHERVEAEIAFSAWDKNRLSTLQDQDNYAMASKFKFQTLDRQVLKFKKVKWSNELQHEFVQSKFKVISPYRAAEFSRDWNISKIQTANEHWLSDKMTLNWGKFWNSQYHFSILNQRANYQGQQHTLENTYADSLTKIYFVWRQLNNSDEKESSRFLRPSVYLERKLGKNFSTILQYDKEQNLRFSRTEDSLISGSFAFGVAQWKLHFNPENGLQFKTEYRLRKDDQILEYSTKSYSYAHEITSSAKSVEGKAGQIEIQASARKIHFKDKGIQDSLGQLYFLGALDHSIVFIKNSIRLKNNYQLSSGVEPKQEFVFEQRRPGEGDYIYIDSNKDGIRQQQEYIYSPQIDSAQYIKIHLFNSEYVQIYSSSWNHFMSIDPALWFNTKKKSILKKIQLESVMRFTNKVSQSAQWQDQLNPLGFNSSYNLSYQSWTQQNVYLNRANVNYEFRLNHNLASAKVLLVSGTEQRSNEEWNFNARYTLKKKLDLNVNLTQKVEKYQASFYSDQNFNIQTFKIEPILLYRWSNEFRISFSSAYKNAMERDFNHEQARIFQFASSTQFALKRKINLRTEIKLLNIDYIGSSSTGIEFIMLEGFKKGRNYSWESGVDIRLSSYINLQLFYNGRKSEEYKTIHTARASMRANF